MGKQICRLCLAYTPVFHSLLDETNSTMLKALTGIEVASNDQVSTVSCVKCLLNVRLAYNTQQNILKCDERLKNVHIADLTPEVKLEETAPSFQLCNQTCVFCGFKVDIYALNEHVKHHFNEQQYCDLCDCYLMNLDEYKAHISNVHPEEKNVVHSCTECKATLQHKCLYNTHMQKVHNVYASRSHRLQKERVEGENGATADESFTCESCNKVFDSERQYRKHSHVKKECPICHAKISRSNFNKHYSNHTSGPQICELCGATLRSVESLRGHMTHTHSTKSFKCEECGKMFNKRYPYIMHKKKHAGEKSHICESCGKAFLTFYYLNKHIKTAHLKLRPYICQFCGKCYSSKFALRTHVRQHTNETPYKCEICGEGFRQNVSLRAHRKSKHNIVEQKTCACPVCGKMFGSEQAIISHMRLH